MKQLIKSLLAIVRKALINDPDNVEEREKLKAELQQALANNAALSAEKSDLEALTPEIEEVIDLATKATPPEPDPTE